VGALREASTAKKHPKGRSEIRSQGLWQRYRLSRALFPGFASDAVAARRRGMRARTERTSRPGGRQLGTVPAGQSCGSETVLWFP